MCTSLLYCDLKGKYYFGRTMELTIDLPYQIAYFPAGHPFSSEIKGHPALVYDAQHAFLSITLPGRIPTADMPIGLADLKVLEGMNDQGLTFSVLSYPSSGGKQASVDMTRAVLSASDLGSWALSQFSSVAALRTALEDQPVMLEPLSILGGAESPFHYVVHDSFGASLVIEFHQGEMTLYDNPVGVMANGPAFDWHLTNLDNYTFLTNVDRSAATFGSYKAVQPDSGIATAGLPASNTSVGRFVRAAYYAQYTEKAESPETAVRTLAHIMNNFDRPRGVTIDYPEEGNNHLEVEGLDQGNDAAYATEFTSWTCLCDLEQKMFFVRDHRNMNFSRFDLGALAELARPKVVPLDHLDGAAPDTTQALKNAVSA